MYICFKTKSSTEINRKFIHEEFYLNGEMYFSTKSNNLKKLPLENVTRITTFDYIIANNLAKR